jgi:hypothetical protein
VSIYRPFWTDQLDMLERHLDEEARGLRRRKAR